MRASIITFLCAGCATSAPIPLPRTAVSRQALVSSGDGVDIRVEPINERNWTEHPALKARMAWDEPAMVWALDAGGHRDLVVPLVPLPSFEVTIENRSPQPVSFANVDLEVDDEAGVSYPVLVDSDAYVAQVIDRMASQVRELLPATIAYGTLLPPWAFAPAKLPSDALAEAARKVPLVRRGIEVAPGQTWTGALVANVWSESPEQLARLLRGRIGVVMRGVKVGAQELEPQSFVFAAGDPVDHVVCSDGTQARSPSECAKPDGYARWMPGGPCLQVGTAHQQHHTSLTYDVQFLDGRRVGNADVYDAMLRTEPSRKAAERARSLRIAGYTLLGGGAVGAVVSAGAIGGTGHSSLAPAGLSALGLSAVGGVLTYLGRRAELQAVRDYNQFAFATGACAAPL
jgi:hypothetical protein